MKLTKMYTDLHNRLDRLEQRDFTHQPIIARVLMMPALDCSVLLGRGNERLEDIEAIVSLLINGLYDDATLSFRCEQGRRRFYLAPDDEPGLNVTQFTALVDAVDATNTFERKHRQAIDTEFLTLNSSDAILTHKHDSLQQAEAALTYELLCLLQPETSRTLS
jgi:hypothetical protein